MNIPIYQSTAYDAPYAGAQCQATGIPPIMMLRLAVHDSADELCKKIEELYATGEYNLDLPIISDAEWWTDKGGDHPLSVCIEKMQESHGWIAEDFPSTEHGFYIDLDNKTGRTATAWKELLKPYEWEGEPLIIQHIFLACYSPNPRKNRDWLAQVKDMADWFQRPRARPRKVWAIGALANGGAVNRQLYRDAVDLDCEGLVLWGGTAKNTDAELAQWLNECREAVEV